MALMAPATAVSQADTPAVRTSDTSVFMCPMHADQSSAFPGKCRRCGMDLMPVPAYETREYRVAIRTVPATIRPGRKTTVVLDVLHPVRTERVTTFAVVHEKPYHLFVVSRDLEFFEHIHPQLRQDGTWSVDVTLPRAGYYQLVSDFLPEGGSSQLIARPLVTAGYNGNAISDGARLVPERPGSQVIENLTGNVSHGPAAQWAGISGPLLTVDLKDTATGRSVDDLQEYLGAFGHMFVMSEDTLEYFHSHPSVTTSSADPTGRRSPSAVTFEGLTPKPGRYRAWIQVQRASRVYTFVHTFSVGDLEVQAR